MTQPNENHSTDHCTTDLQAHSFPKLGPRICLFDQHAVQTDRTGTAYSATELSDLKNCLKFATKLMVRGGVALEREGHTVVRGIRGQYRAWDSTYRREGSD